MKSAARDLAGSAVLLAMLAGAAPADAQLVISKAPTSNVNCSGGICTATGAQAVLNVKQLKTLLRQGDVTVAQASAPSLTVAAAVAWTKKTKLTLHATPAYVAAPIKVNGKGSLDIEAQGQGGPALSFSSRGSVIFTDIRHSHLTINALPYVLAANLQGLIDGVAAHAGNAFALVNDDDASQYGTFSKSPVAGALLVPIEGLGHTIANLHIDNTEGDSDVGLISKINPTGALRDLNLSAASIQSGDGSCVGSIVGNNQGAIANLSVGGTVSATGALDTGGLVGCNFGSIDRSFANVAVTGNVAGGLVGNQGGTVHDVMASGAVISQAGPNSPSAGGLLGEANGGSVQSSYSLGAPSGSGAVGGFVGSAFSGTFSQAYWNTTTSGTFLGCNFHCSGITGMSTAELQAGLPAGFSPAIWAQSARINGGMPYLLAAMPR